MNRGAVKREHLIAAIVRSGLTYNQAALTYKMLMAEMEDAVVSGKKIYLGHVGVLVPKVKPPRRVVMGFERKPGGKVVHESREFCIGRRLEWKLRIHRSFTSTRRLDWL